MVMLLFVQAPGLSYQSYVQVTALSAFQLECVYRIVNCSRYIHVRLWPFLLPSSLTLCSMPQIFTPHRPQTQDYKSIMTGYAHSSEPVLPRNHSGELFRILVYRLWSGER